VKPSRDIARLIEIMAALRTPGSGCPWDLEQNFRTIAPYTLEEAYEVADAIARGDLADLKDELGDLLLQVVFHARMAAEHVKGLWERIKEEEKAERGEAPKQGALAGVPLALPALTRALKLQSKAGRVGFDWNNPHAVLAKIREEADEIEAELDTASQAEAAAEVGDLLFAVVNLARHLNADPEDILRQTNLKFERRFAAIERALAARGKSPQEATLAEMDALWDEAKKAEGGQ
jgi:ATP diphosphatase